MSPLQFTIVFLIISVVAGVAMFLSLESYYSNDYWRDFAPDGWYHQRSYVQQSDLINNGTMIFFPICDHSYLGPLHGTFKITCNLTEGRYDFHVVNNVIVEARSYGGA